MNILAALQQRLAAALGGLVDDPAPFAAHVKPAQGAGRGDYQIEAKCFHALRKHLGDWGTQFGILLYGYKNFLDRQAYEHDPVEELARLYIHVRGLFRKKGEDEEDEGAGDDPVAAACRAETAKLHAGDPENLELWKQFMPHALALIEAIYRRLGVLPFDHQHGESFYNPMLPGVVDDLLARGIAFESQGAIV